MVKGERKVGPLLTYGTHGRLRQLDRNAIVEEPLGTGGIGVPTRVKCGRHTEETGWLVKGGRNLMRRRAGGSGGEG
jgi:hypothetical protein